MGGGGGTVEPSLSSWTTSTPTSSFPEKKGKVSVMNMKKVTVSRIAKKQIIHHCLVQADRIPVALQRNRLYTTVFFASRPNSGRIAKKQIIHHCLLRADQIPVALQRNGLYTTVFFASRPNSGRIAKKQIIHLLQGGWKHPLSIMNI
jgi:hypothetical protein